MSRPLLETIDLSVGYAGRAVLKPFSESIPAGRLVCLLGANGSGKSTVLRTLAGLQPAIAGEVLLARSSLAGLSAKARARLLALVLTDRVTVPSMRGAELVALGRHPHTGWSGRLSDHDRMIIRKALGDTGSLSLADRLIAELSDGERQRILIARALAQEPSVLMLDEATAFLDLPRRVELMHLLRKIARERSIAVLLSTHDLELALRYADDVWLLDAANLMTTGAPEDLVLSGHLEVVFQKQGLVFDMERGTLHVAEPARGAVRVEASGKDFHWLVHAARRAGFEAADDASTTISCLPAGFRLSRPGLGALEVGSVRELVNALRKEPLQ